MRGEWVATPGIGWQHGPVPDAPDGLHAETVDVWTTWMRAWFASNWTPDDLPGLAVVVRIYEAVRSFYEDPYVEKKVRGKDETVFVLKPNPTGELRQLMDNYGITPKGQQDRRWSRPKDAPVVEPEATPDASPYGHLRAV